MDLELEEIRRYIITIRSKKLELKFTTTESTSELLIPKVNLNSYNNFKKSQELRSAINRYKSVRNKIVKVKASVTFLIRCRNTGIIPKFIRNSTKNIFYLFEPNGIPIIQQRVSKNIQFMQNKILSLAIKQKHELLKQLSKELEWITANLKYYFSRDQFNTFITHQDGLAMQLNFRVKEVHKQKFNCLIRLQNRDLNIRYNKKYFVNKSDFNIPAEVQWVLSLGQKHALPIKNDDIPFLKVIAEGEDFIQTLTEREEQETARNIFTDIISNNLHREKLTNRDKFMLDKVNTTKNFLRNNGNLLILNADKGNSTVAMNKCDYVSRMNNIVGDVTTYKLVNRDPTTKLQTKNNNLVEELFRTKIITSLEKNKLKTNISSAPRLYGLPKIHKQQYPLRPICSFINSPSYELCKYITNILKKITENSKYNVKDSLQFRDKIKSLKIQYDEKLISLDVVSLFPSIPIDIALDIVEEKWDVIKEYTKIEKNLFMRILNFCITENRYFKYDKSIYVQLKGLPMGSPASPIMADIVMEKLLDTCIGKLSVKPKIITKYVDDLFCIASDHSINDIMTTFNSFHNDIQFTIEKECNSKIAYLDTLVIRRGDSLLIDWYQKPTSSGRLINYYSKHPKRIIINTAKNFIERILKISDTEFHNTNIERIKDILSNNNYQIQLTSSLIRQYNNRNNLITRTITEPKIYKSLTYVPLVSERLEKSKIYDHKKYVMAHKMYNTLGKLFSNTKDKIDKLDFSNLVYKIPCGDNDNENCNKVYVGTTKNKLKSRIAGHKSDYKYMNTTLTQKTALSLHCSNSNHCPDFKNTVILNTENGYRRRLMLEMLQIIKVPITQRIIYKVDTANVAQNYRYLVNRCRN